MRWIERDPSTGSSANNHRLGELVGVVAVAPSFRSSRGSDRRLERALAELEAEVERQIRPTEPDAEQAFAYQVFVLDLLLVALACARRTGLRPPESLCAALTRSGDALWAQLGDDEPEPRYGDSDDGRALVLDAAPTALRREASPPRSPRASAITAPRVSPACSTR